MKLSRADAVRVFILFRVWTAPEWPVARFQAKLDDLRTLRRYFEGADPFSEGPDLELATELIHAQERGDPIEVVDDGSLERDMAKAAAQKTGTKKPKRADKPRPDRTKTPYKARVKDWQARPVKMRKEGGVMQIVLRELRAASVKGEPVTKEFLLGILKAEFPERDESGMTTNLNNMIPTRFREHYGIHVWRKRAEGGRMAYWIEGDGSKPQPKT